MLLWTLAFVACGYVALSATALGILVAFERRTGNVPDWWGVVKVAFGWPIVLVAAAVFHKR